MGWCAGSVAAIAVAFFGVASLAAQAAMGEPPAAPDAEAAAAMRQKIDGNDSEVMEVRCTRRADTVR